LHFCTFELNLSKSDSSSWLALSELNLSYQYSSGLKAPDTLSGLTPYLSPRSNNTFSDNTTSKVINFTPSVITWVQTTLMDFEAGTLANIDASSQPGNATIVPSLYNPYAYYYNNSNGTLVSQVFDAGAKVDWGNISWTKYLPPDTSLAIQTKTGNVISDGQITDGVWSDMYLSAAGSQITSTNGTRFLQWRANFSTTNDSAAPILSDVNLTFVRYEKILNITIPKFSLLNSLTLGISSCPCGLPEGSTPDWAYCPLTMTFAYCSPSVSVLNLSVDVLADNSYEWAWPDGTGEIPVDTSTYLEGCTPVSYTEEGPMCDLPIRIVASDGNPSNYTSLGTVKTEVNYTFTNILWAYQGAEYRLLRGGSVSFDLMSYSSSFTTGVNSAALTYPRGLENLDNVFVFGVDRAGNRNKSNYTNVAPVFQPSPTPSRPYLMIELTLHCAGEEAIAKVTDNRLSAMSDASVTVSFGGKIFASGSANEDGEFRFTPTFPGTYYVYVSKEGYDSKTEFGTASDCACPPSPIIEITQKILCASGNCNAIFSGYSPCMQSILVDLSPFLKVLHYATFDRVIDSFGSVVSGAVSTVQATVGSLYLPLTTQHFEVRYLLPSVTLPAPTWSDTNKLNITIRNAGDAFNVTGLSIELPADFGSRTIRSITYLPQGATEPIEIPAGQWHREGNYIIIDQEIEIRTTG
jgi:hypothetical protein